MDKKGSVNFGENKSWVVSRNSWTLAASETSLDPSSSLQYLLASEFSWASSNIACVGLMLLFASKQQRLYAPAENGHADAERGLSKMRICWLSWRCWVELACRQMLKLGWWWWPTRQEELCHTFQQWCCMYANAADATTWCGQPGRSVPY